MARETRGREPRSRSTSAAPTGTRAGQRALGAPQGAEGPFECLGVAPSPKTSRVPPQGAGFLGCVWDASEKMAGVLPERARGTDRGPRPAEGAKEQEGLGVEHRIALFLKETVGTGTRLAVAAGRVQGQGALERRAVWGGQGRHPVVGRRAREGHRCQAVEG